MKLLLYPVFFLVGCACAAQEAPAVPGLTAFDSLKGDLDRDGIAELVVAYDTAESDSTTLGVRRRLHVYKLSDGKWSLWQESSHALLDSENGGMLGDPFAGFEIRKGILKIHHSGGSSWRWSHTDLYRWNGAAFRLIGHTETYGKPCQYRSRLDFNLSTGKIVYFLDPDLENCDDGEEPYEAYKPEKETFFYKNLIITLQNRYAREIEIVSPELKKEFRL